MASSRGTQNGPDMQDILATWEAFESINSCIVTCALTRLPSKGEGEIVLSGAAWAKELSNLVSGQQLLTSAICSVTHYTSLENALFHLLYMLDGQLASSEMANAGKK